MEKIKNLNYQELIEIMVPRPINSVSQYKKAMKIIDSLSVRDDLNRDEEDYLYVLAMLVGKYEDVNYSMKDEPIDTIEMLKFLLEQNSMKPSDLGNLFGDKKLGVKILKRQYNLSERDIKVLSKHFYVDKKLFSG